MRTGWDWRGGVVFVVLAVGSAPSLAQTVQLNPSKDNTLYQDDFGANTSNGQGQNFFVGRTARDLIRRGVIAFDIAGNIPAGATIESVTLTVHTSSTRDTPEIQVDLHMALSDWGEGASNADADGGGGAGAPAEPGDATWLNTFYPDQLWGSEGGDFADAVTSSAAVSSVGFFTFDSAFDAGLVSDVQQWLDQPDTNFGWLLKAADEFFPMSAKRFDTRENIEPTFQPLLTVTYSSCGVQLNPSKDNTLYEDESGGTTSNGQGQNFFVGPVGSIGNGLVRRGLIAFDIAGNIPAGATIESVTLTLHASSTRQTPNIQVDLYAALSDWGEGASNADEDAGGGQGAPAEPGDATWVNTFFPDQVWGAEGGDFGTSPTSSTVVSAEGFFSFDSTVDAGLMTDVQQWLDQPDTNFGWLLKASDEAFTGSAKRFASRENAEPTFQPLLIVTYSCGASTNVGAIPPPPTVTPETSADPAASALE